MNRSWILWWASMDKTLLVSLWQRSVKGMYVYMCIYVYIDKTLLVSLWQRFVNSVCTCLHVYMRFISVCGGRTSMDKNIVGLPVAEIRERYVCMSPCMCIYAVFQRCVWTTHA